LKDSLNEKNRKKLWKEGGEKNPAKRKVYKHSLKQKKKGRRHGGYWVKERKKRLKGGEN